MPVYHVGPSVHLVHGKHGIAYVRVMSWSHIRLSRKARTTVEYPFDYACGDMPPHYPVPATLDVSLTAVAYSYNQKAMWDFSSANILWLHPIQ